MEKLFFDRKKYGTELLIDACTVQELDLVDDTLVLSFYTIILLRAGSGKYSLDTEQIDLQPNSILFVKPGQINAIREAQFNEGHFLFFEGDFLDEFFKDTYFIQKFSFFQEGRPSGCLPLDAATFDPFDRISAEIRDEIRALGQDSHHILRSLIYYLLVRLHQRYGQAFGSGHDTLLDQRLLQFLRLLEAPRAHTQTVEAYANRIGISRVHLNSLCQKHFSKTAHQLIRERLLGALKKEIKYTEKDLATIAYDFQFSAPSHFTRFFRQMMGITPQAYRESLSNW